MSLLSQLREWRNDQARVEGVEVFRVLPNAALEALAGALPQSKEEMLTIKGIKEAKYRKYGAALLKIIKEQTHSFVVPVLQSADKHPAGIQKKKSWIPDQVGDDKNDLEVRLPNYEDNRKRENEDQTLSVSQFLDGLNVELSGMAARVRGEVSSVDVRERVVYFTLKDSRDESTLNCLIFRYQYEVSGVQIAPGDEIIVEGVPEIYKPSGRLSLKVGIIELFGEGALKKAYEMLKAKLEREGLFAPERKRPLPEFPETIALVTSEQGAAIGDFTINLRLQQI